MGAVYPAKLPYTRAGRRGVSRSGVWVALVWGGKDMYDDVMWLDAGVVRHGEPLWF